MMSDRELPAEPGSPPESAQDELVDVEVVTESEHLADDVLPPVRVVAAEGIEEDVAVVDERSLPVKLWHRVCSSLEWLFGLASVIAGLALIASLPIVQFLSLGYLLEVSGRICRTGRIRNGFIGIREAARLGSLVLGTWLMLWPIRFASSLWQSATLIDPGSGITIGWRIFLLVFTVVMIGHILLAWCCGGKVRHFFWPFLAPLFFGMWGLRRLVASRALRPVVQPVVGTISKKLLRDLTTVPALNTWFPPAILWANIRQGRVYIRARDAVWEYAAAMRLPYYFWLGIRGFAGATAWLFVPVMLIIATTNLDVPAAENQQAVRAVAGLAGFLGSTMLAGVVMYLPFLQTHFAAEGRFVAMFDIFAVHKQLRRAPVAFWFALLITLGFALPLYLLKIEMIPRETMGLASIVFVVFMLPARIMTGWAMSRGRKREKPRFFLMRWAAVWLALPLVGFYSFLVFFTQFLLWYGSFSLFEQHAFLPPVPFLGL